MNLAARSFHIPPYLNAKVPAEYRGIRRDSVQLMALDTLSGKTFHSRFYELDAYLQKGDLLVLNNSRTIPAVLFGKKGNQTIEIRLSRRLSERDWEAIFIGGMISVGEVIEFPGDLTATLLTSENETPLVIIRFSQSGIELYHSIYKYGRPIRYEYIETPWPLDAYQTVYGSVPGSVEMPSAGRAFSWRLLQRLKEKGINIAFLQLHAGLSYYGKDSWPDPRKHLEPFCVPEETARLVNETKSSGNRVIAVGTTVVRALETATNAQGDVESQEGLTGLYIQQDFELQAVDGLITGFHEPEASHLDLLTAFIDETVLIKAYQEALHTGYLWHEFGDMNIILPMEEHS